MAAIFISYRREDAAGWAGRLQENLRRAFPAHDVFYDIGSIGIGEDFVDVMRRSLASCAVVIVLIGPRWLQVNDEAGRRRLDDPEDWVRLEVAESLQRQGLRVVPVLVGAASMPKVADLPEPLKPLARRNAHEITDRRWDYDVTQLVAALKKISSLEATHDSAPPDVSRGRPSQGVTSFKLFMARLLPPTVQAATPAPAPSTRVRTGGTAGAGGAEADARAGLEAVLRQHAADPRARVEAVEAFVKEEGDPRFRADAWQLPDDPLLGFIEVPAGPFRMGSDRKRDRQAFDDESPSHEVTLSVFYVARWPVTVAQFAAFVRDSRFAAGDSECLRGAANDPVTLVSWEESLRYCAWLTGKLRSWAGTPQPLAALLRQEPDRGRQPWQVTLPSEAEWEKAARATDARIYPWNDGKRKNEGIDSNRANIDQTGIGCTSPVGCFPRGACACGAEDMSGNVWEWTRSLSRRYPYDPRDGREDLNRQGTRVVRGGSFNSSARRARAAFRIRNDPVYRHFDIGFRVVVSRF